MRPRDLNFGQRVVAIVSLAAVLRVTGAYIIGRNTLEGGWFSYAPLSSEVPYFSTGRSFGTTLVWVFLIVVWAVASIWLLGLPYTRSGGSSDREGAP